MSSPKRIRLDMTAGDAIMAIAGGNPGALNVCVMIMQDGGAIDPDSALGPAGAILSLDQHGVYESRIWMLYKDVCGQDLVKTLACLRGVQLGFLREADLNHAIDNRGAGLDVDAVLADVRKRLPRFAQEKAVSP